METLLLNGAERSVLFWVSKENNLKNLKDLKCWTQLARELDNIKTVFEVFSVRGCYLFCLNLERMISVIMRGIFGWPSITQINTLLSKLFSQMLNLAISLRIGNQFSAESDDLDQTFRLLRYLWSLISSPPGPRISNFSAWEEDDRGQFEHIDKEWEIPRIHPLNILWKIFPNWTFLAKRTRKVFEIIIELLANPLLRYLF